MFVKKLVEDFGSFTNWEKGFRATASLHGIGWTMLHYDPMARRLFNVWINEHDDGRLSGAIPLLIIDVFEQAFMVDYGLKLGDYVAAFFEVIDWSVVIKKFNDATMKK